MTVTRRAPHFRTDWLPRTPTTRPFFVAKLDPLVGLWKSQEDFLLLLVQNCYVESFNGRMRDECLNSHWFTDIDDARRTIKAWTKEYNEEREHGTLGMTPREFAKSAVESAEIANSAISALPTVPAATEERTANGPADHAL